MFQVLEFQGFGGFYLACLAIC